MIMPFHTAAQRWLTPICDCDSFTTLSDALLPALAEAVGADSASYRQVFYGQGVPTRLGHSASHGLPADVHARFCRDFITLDGAAHARPPQSGRSDVQPLAALVAPRAFQRSAAYEAFYGPHGMHHLFVMRIDHGPAESHLFGLHRPASERPFGAAALQRAQDLLPVLRGTLRRLHAEASLRPLMQTAEAAALTPRELELAMDVAQALPNKAIAKRRGISQHTVANHLRTVFAKLGLHHRTELALWVRQHLPPSSTAPEPCQGE